MIVYTESWSHLTPESFAPGFFAGWPNPPTPATHLRLLQGSYRVWLALDDDLNHDRGQVVGFINAISDGVLAAFIPLLEVVPAYQGRGIGTELTRRMLHSLAHLYSIDVMCDASVQPFYARLGLQPCGGMIQRHYAHQSGAVRGA
ncbi:MAG: GNAT family N-acetyltransferase [Anaerolineae bacterium]|jgi:GNAT superfamily N-acetyltransferase|nr:GNAT family N-acetyltransferase [Anaerolineae bacterium]